MGSNDIESLIEEGIKLRDLGEFKKAIKCFHEAGDGEKCCYTLILWGNKLYNQAKKEQNESLFKEAFDKYDLVAQNSDSDVASNAFASWGDALYDLAKTKQDESLFRKAIEKYEKATQQEAKDIWPFIEWANALCDLAKIKQDESLFREAIEKYDEIGDYDDILIKRGIAFAYLAEIKQDKSLYKNVTESFEKTKKSILYIFVHLNKEDEERIIKAEILYPLLNSGTEDGDSFNEATKDISPEKLDIYKEIYIRSIFIISRLHINREYEKSVAHYTKKTIAQELLFNESKFRLNAIDNSNDPSEGKTLLDYLFKDKPFEKEKYDTEYRAFAGCFTFQHDSLNQFRLYGKDQNQEGTGLSLIFNEGFFSRELRMATSNKKPKISPAEKMLGFKDEDEDEKYPLFRCIYIDPEKQQVETVGQKEITKKEDEMRKKYNIYIDDVFDIVNKKMEELKNLIHGLDQNVIGQLLINLRYLTKHVAFKEEQECRIVRICSINREDKIDFDEDKMYIEYKPDVIPRIEKIYFGPKATNIELFRDRLAIELKCKIECIKSENPLA